MKVPSYSTRYTTPGCYGLVLVVTTTWSNDWLSHTSQYYIIVTVSVPWPHGGGVVSALALQREGLWSRASSLYPPPEGPDTYFYNHWVILSATYTYNFALVFFISVLIFSASLKKKNIQICILIHFRPSPNCPSVRFQGVEIWLTPLSICQLRRETHCHLFRPHTSIPQIGKYLQWAT